MIGFFGDIVFETNDKRILNFSGFSRSASARWHNHDTILKKPAAEFLGPDLDSVSFSITVNASMVSNPLDEINKWLIKCRAGTTETLVIGNRGIGMDQWSVQSVSQAYNIIYNHGEVYSASVDVTLEEYIRRL